MCIRECEMRYMLACDGIKLQHPEETCRSNGRSSRIIDLLYSLWLADSSQDQSVVGKAISTAVPLPNWLRNVSLPLCASTIRWQTASPRPVPFSLSE